MEELTINTVFTLGIFGKEIPITETVVISWIIMLFLVIVSLVFTCRLKEIPSGPQALLETGMEFLNNFAREHFGRFSKFLGPYMGSLLLFLLVANIIGVVSPVTIKAFGHEFIPPFSLKPPTKDINVSAAFAVISITMVLVCGFAARGFTGWFKQLLYPFPVMLPFNLMDYGTRLISLCLRLFGNILGAFVLMSMIEGLFPLALPMVFSLYFDFFDGAMQAGIFVFLTSLYIEEAIKIEPE